MRNIICFFCILISIALGVVCFFVLPDVIIVQTDEIGDAIASIPKILVIIIPFIFCLFGGMLFTKSESFIKGIIIFSIGFMLNILILILNVLI